MTWVMHVFISWYYIEIPHYHNHVSIVLKCEDSLIQSVIKLTLASVVDRAELLPLWCIDPNDSESHDGGLHVSARSYGWRVVNLERDPLRRMLGEQCDT
jgi:hypothetical protein